MAATRMSAVRHTAGRSAVREWHMVTVQSALTSNMAMGRPTMALRPITTARLPRVGTPLRRSSSIQREGELDEDAVDAVVLVHSQHDLADRLGAAVGGRPAFVDTDPQLLGDLSLEAHVGRRRSVVAAEDDAQPGAGPESGQLADARLHLLADGGRDRSSVDDQSAHAPAS